ncbi:hypothetical protein JF710_11865 [Mycobacterium intracellulare]|uniref:hypothetical protein n=1 Tax=Mycobacterium intracellulare TaxID=1767 RepID=UPI001CDA7303|nr:hypothetical protein [Mycobacterium intracellulare]MCA2253866.1 hypothetical protein [Mycobacterium intracellulare]
MRGSAAIAPDILRLYRGIAVPVDDVDATKDSIKTKGLDNTVRWALPDFSAEELFRDPLSYYIDRATFPVLGACGDEGGATYYACRHHRTKEATEPLVVVFDAPVEDCLVDCRDLLCTVFQRWDSMGGNSKSDVLAALRQIFGASIARYFEAAAATTEHEIRIGLCNGASYDREVVLGHYSNDVCWQGRHQVRCRSAFAVRGPVPPMRIVDVRKADESQIPTPTITLDDLL